MSPPASGLRSHQFWFLVFGVWLLLLSGVLSSLIRTPGVLQVFQLSRLLDKKQKELFQLEEALHQTQEEIRLLEKNKAAQRREIRKTLGYVAPDEWIFDFID